MIATNRLLLSVVLLGLACSPPALTKPFSGLQSGVCTLDSECDVGRCPNACALGWPSCGYPQVFSRADILRKCPCAETPSKDECAAPDVSACGPVPACARPSDIDKMRARCIGGTCVARFTDGGTVP